MRRLIGLLVIGDNRSAARRRVYARGLLRLGGEHIQQRQECGAAHHPESKRMHHLFLPFSSVVFSFRRRLRQANAKAPQPQAGAGAIWVGVVDHLIAAGNALQALRPTQLSGAPHATGSCGNIAREPAASSASRRGRSSAPSQRAITIVATPLPMMFVRARASLINRSIPKINARPATGTEGTTISVAAKVMNPAPLTPEAPLEVSIATTRIPSCCDSVRSMLSACATNRAAMVRKMFVPSRLNEYPMEIVKPTTCLEQPNR